MSEHVDQSEGTRPEFVQYYAEASRSDQTRRRFLATRDVVLRFMNAPGRSLEVADIGSGAGSQAVLWAELGHRVHGLDISPELVAVARTRAASAGHDIEFCVGSATRVPWPDASMDVCLVPELLEHVPEWRECLDEFARILRPDGILFIGTTNRLCPVQSEFTLPGYSWYPEPLKRHYVRLARTTRPEIAGYATYPAVNWFTFYGLRAELRWRGFRSFDRFDAIDVSRRGVVAATVVHAIRAWPPVRWLAHCLTPYTWVLAVKQPS